MTTKRTQPKRDDVNELKHRLEQQAEQIAAQRRRIAELETLNRGTQQSNLNQAALNHHELGDLLKRNQELENKLRLSEELRGYAEQEKKQASRNECKMLPIRKERTARAWAAFGVLIRYGAIPMPVLDVVDKDQAAGVCFDVNAMLGIVELSLEAADILDTTPYESED